MKLLIAGTRTIHPSIADIDDAVARLAEQMELPPGSIGFLAGITHVISGCAHGVDEAGEAWAHARLCPPACIASRWQGRARGLAPIHQCQTIERYPADWSMGRMAGPIRNGKMARACDGAVLFWNQESPGTRDMIGKLEELGKPKVVIPMGVAG